MKEILFSPAKNIQLQKDRGINLEKIADSIENGTAVIIDIICHPNKDKYPHQKIFIVEMNTYIYLIPFVENDTTIFLKTIFPSRKYKKSYSKK